MRPRSGLYQEKKEVIMIKKTIEQLRYVLEILEDELKDNHWEMKWLVLIFQYSKESHQDRIQERTVELSAESFALEKAIHILREKLKKEEVSQI
jgi:hypothetical protein